MGEGAAVLGGTRSVAVGAMSSIIGGDFNAAVGLRSIAGGSGNRARGDDSAAIGGFANEAQGQYSSVSGGRQRVAPGESDWQQVGFSKTSNLVTTEGARNPSGEAAQRVCRIRHKDTKTFLGLLVRHDGERLAVTRRTYTISCTIRPHAAVSY